MDDHAQEIEEVELPELLDGIIAEQTATATKILWQPAESCLIQVNSIALRRVLVNLLENALRYGGDLVEVRYQCHSHTTIVEILDSGSGIPEDQIKTVFQPFYRLETSRNTATGGSGLGLAIVQQLCHANGWQIRLDNREKGGLITSVKIPTNDS
jgi:two-component system osmolarity sensor histidine kinase EnvZ